MIIGDIRQRLGDRMSCAELLSLQAPVQILVGKGRSHAFGAVTVNDAYGLRLKLPRAVEHMRKQRTAGERMQDLGQIRAHALALARGQDDDGDRHVRGPSTETANDDTCCAARGPADVNARVRDSAWRRGQ